MKTEAYLGDGLYASYDGYHIKLMANSHDHPTDTVALEPCVYETLKLWVKEGYRDYHSGQTFTEVVQDVKTPSSG